MVKMVKCGDNYKDMTIMIKLKTMQMRYIEIEMPNLSIKAMAANYFSAWQNF